MKKEKTDMKHEEKKWKEEKGKHGEMILHYKASKTLQLRLLIQKTEPGWNIL